MKDQSTSLAFVSPGKATPPRGRSATAGAPATQDLSQKYLLKLPSH